MAGLVGSVTHCTGMCSPFVLAQTQAGPALQKPVARLLLPYHLGRMTTYTGLGILVHSVVNLAYLVSTARTLVTVPLLMLASIIFLVSAFPVLVKIFPWAAAIRLPDTFPRLARKAYGLMQKQDPWSRYILGLVLGFLPCGLVIAALMAASTAPTIFGAALAIMAFAIGTMPSLIAVGLCGTGLKQKFPAFSYYFSKVAMTVSSLWLLVLAGSLIL